MIAKLFATIMYCLSFCILLTSCKQTKEGQLFELLSAKQTGVDFSNTLSESDTFNVLEFEYLYNGGGVGVGDVNNDGLTDIYFGGNMVSSKLYLNKGNFQFEDITLPAGVGTKSWATGVSMVDINQDGLLDIHVCTIHPDINQSSPNLLFINKGPDAKGIPTFTEAAAKIGLADTGYSTQAAFFDYDRDGDLDIYLLTNALETHNRNNPKGQRKDGLGRSTDRLYRNEGSLKGALPTFTNVSKDAGITIEGWGLGIGICDINKDGWPDVYVGNDFMSNDLLWINNKNGTFSNHIDKYLKHQSHNSMGTDIADFNNDGLTDIVVLDMMPETNERQKSMFPAANYDRYHLNKQMGYQPQYVRNVLQLNNGNGTFSEIGQLAGVYNTDWSWSTLFADYDNDGWRDLLITNGYHKDVTDLDYITYSRESSQFGNHEHIKKRLVGEVNKLKGVKIPNYIFKNNGDLTFSNQTSLWGMDQPSYSNGTAYADFDKDGDLDLVVNNINDEAFIYRNLANAASKEKPSNHYLRVNLSGSASNKAGLGTTVTIRYNGKKQFYEHYIYRGYKSTVEDVIHFGLGKVDIIDSVEVTWPDGKFQLLQNIPANQVITVAYTNAKEKPVTADSQVACLFTDASNQYDIAYKHQESEYIDFKSQPLLPHKHSQNGPGIAVGDIDNNGLEDFFIGGSAQHSGQLFYQMQEGKFKAALLTSQDKKYEEDMGSLLFDADNDGDLDLYVVSGGSEYKENSPYYQDRLYINSGKGEFTLNTEALPTIQASGSCVIAADYDKDGDLDLFVGGRIVPNQYPLPARSYILQNNEGRFTDVTTTIAPQIQAAGLVTSALWTDFDNDSQIDLLLAGEWMPLTFFKNVGGKFTEVTSRTGLLHATGWWNSLTAGDFDNDGDTDYIAGNLGLNTRYKASPQEPVSLYAKDFDKNSRIDPILCYYIGGKNYPAHPRDALIDQINGMRGRFSRYADYGKATIDQVFSEKELEGARILKSDNMQSSYIENMGKGKFTIHALPMLAQVAPAYGILAKDADADGNIDILMTGNSYAADIQSGMLDAFIGLYLKGNGKGNFSPVPVTESGFFVDGDAKGLSQVALNNGKSMILVACNSDSLQTFGSPVVNQHIKVEPYDMSATITYKDGKKRKEELYYGSSYLSQSSRIISITKQVVAIEITDYQGKSRSIPFQQFAAKQ